MKCDFCSSDKQIEIYPSIVQCAVCKLVYAKHQKDFSFYCENEDDPREGREWIITNDVADRIKWIGEANGKRILEVGGGYGDLLLELRHCGAEVFGIEPNQKRADFSRSLGIPISSRPITDAILPHDFDIVVSFHTIEHVESPLNTFCAIHKALKTGGKFMGEVPNQNDWRLKLFDDMETKRCHYSYYHNYFFTPSVINKYLNSCGFDIIEISTIERYNSLSRLKRIIRGDHRTSLESDRTRIETRIEREFNQMFAKGVNAEFMGNCIRWIAWK